MATTVTLKRPDGQTIQAYFVGITGVCMGVALTLLSLCMSIEIDAGAVWYGCPAPEYIDATKPRALVLGHFDPGR